MKLTLNINWKDWSWSYNGLATWCQELTHWEIPWCWERLKAGGEGGDRGWDGWMASPTPWMWVWASSGRWWRTGKSGVLQSMGSQRVGHDWAAEWQQRMTGDFSAHRTGASWPQMKYECVARMWSDQKTPTRSPFLPLNWVKPFL